MPDRVLLTLIKGSEKYIFVFDDSCESRAEALRQLGRWATNQELSFTWYDAAVLSQKIRQAKEANAKEAARFQS